MKTTETSFEVVTVTLNPAIDRTVSISNFKAGAVNRVKSVRSNPGVGTTFSILLPAAITED